MKEIERAINILLFAVMCFLGLFAILTIPPDALFWYKIIVWAYGVVAIIVGTILCAKEDTELQ
jgi:hypothetical protein